MIEFLLQSGERALIDRRHIVAVQAVQSGLCIVTTTAGTVIVAEPLDVIRERLKRYDADAAKLTAKTDAPADDPPRELPLSDCRRLSWEYLAREYTGTQEWELERRAELSEAMAGIERTHVEAMRTAEQVEPEQVTKGGD